MLKTQSRALPTALLVPLASRAAVPMAEVGSQADFVSGTQVTNEVLILLGTHLASVRNEVSVETDAPHAPGTGPYANRFCARLNSSARRSS